MRYRAETSAANTTWSSPILRTASMFSGWWKYVLRNPFDKGLNYLLLMRHIVAS